MKKYVCENCGRRFASRRKDDPDEKECVWCHKTMKVVWERKEKKRKSK